MKNIFIIGPVASGKSTLMNKILDKYNIVALDTGLLYRYVAKIIFDKIKDDIDINTLSNKDSSQIDIVNKFIYTNSNYYTNKLNSLTFTNNKLYEGAEELNLNQLYEPSVNILLPIVAKISTIRNRIVNYINNICDGENPIIMTGHNIKEIDTTKFTVVYLDVDSKIAAYRLIGRNSSSYKDIIDAYNEVIIRNKTDRIEETKNIIPYLYNYIYIDTSSKNDEEVFETFVKEYNNFIFKEEKFKELQENSIQRENFIWMFHTVLQPIKDILVELSSDIVKKYPFINQNDLIYQTLIILTSYNLDKILDISDEDLNYIENSIKNRDINAFNYINKKITNDEIKINMGIVSKTLIDSTLNMLDYYRDDDIRRRMIEYNKSNNKTTFMNKKGMMICQDELEKSDEITFRKLDSKDSKFISTYCHYLHTPRNDELVSYGAFLNREQYPIAYVSFSKQDRSYKKELLYYLGIEPQNTIEMTRAWCSNNAPSNIMSSLFQYSIDDIQKDWKERSKNCFEDKYLQAVTTAINPNLGFSASSFLGCNFIPIAVRPAKFTFVNENGIIKYETRRKIQDENHQSVFFENKFSILPLNELILCVDKNRQENVINSNIILIEKDDYESVLNEKVKKKVKKYE